jgi:transposase
MRNRTLMLTHPEASRERLLAIVRLIRGAHMGIKIAALLLILKGQRPGWIADVLGLTRQSLDLWMHRVNDRGLKTLAPVKQPGCPPRLSSKVRQGLEEDLEKPPSEFGLPRVRWDGPTLVVHLKRQFGISYHF